MNDIVYSLRYWALPPPGETREPTNAGLLIAAAAEIERLRGLLREGLGLVDEDWTLKDPIHLGEWEDRVREALGE